MSPAPTSPLQLFTSVSLSSDACSNVVLPANPCMLTDSVPNLKVVEAFADPGSWGIPASAAGPFANEFLTDRAAVAHGLNKPYILEETGVDVRNPNNPMPHVAVASGHACLQVDLRKR